MDCTFPRILFLLFTIIANKERRGSGQIGGCPPIDNEMHKKRKNFTLGLIVPTNLGSMIGGVPR